MKMMSYRYDNKKKRYGYLAGVIVIIILFFTPFLSTAFDVLEKPLLTAWNQSGENIQKVEGFFARFYSKQKLHEKNQLLQQRIGIF